MGVVAGGWEFLVRKRLATGSQAHAIAATCIETGMREDECDERRRPQQNLFMHLLRPLHPLQSFGRKTAAAQ